MKQVTVNKKDLIDKVQANHDNHRAIFEAALTVYQERLVEYLEARVDDARKGRKVNHYIDLPVPEDHTNDYDRVLEMLSMEIEDEVTIDASEFARYVMDQWVWREAFLTNSGNYAAASGLVIPNV